MIVMLRSLYTHLAVFIFTDVFVFDNSYSRLHSKEVEYIVEVLYPHEFSQDKVNKQLESFNVIPYDTTSDSNKY